MISQKRWTVEVQDTSDGSGDGLLQLPVALWTELEAEGWEVGNVLAIDVTGAGRAVIRNQYAECRRLGTATRCEARAMTSVSTDTPVAVILGNAELVVLEHVREKSASLGYAPSSSPSDPLCRPQNWAIPLTK